MEERHTHEERDEARRQSRERRLRRHRLWRSVRPLIVGLLSIGVCIGLLWGGIKLVLEEFIYPVDVCTRTLQLDALLCAEPAFCLLPRHH